jgi:short-subunit dehydrogenase
MRSTRLISMGGQASPEDVATAGWRAMKAGQRRHIPGLMNKLFFTLPRLLPRPLIAKIMKQLYARKH